MAPPSLEPEFRTALIESDRASSPGAQAMRPLAFMVCDHFRLEVESVLAEMAIPGATVHCLPALCGRPPLTEPEVAGRTPRGASAVVLGSVCLAGLGPFGESGADGHRLENCFELVAPRDLVWSLLSEHGAYLASPGWLAEWRPRLSDMGLDRAAARAMFGDATRVIVLLDTGVDPEAPRHLARMADFVGCPSQAIRVGLDVVRGRIEQVVRGHELASHADGVARRPADAARHAMAADPVGDARGAATGVDQRRRAH